MTNVVICRLVATSLSATWHLIPMFKNELGGGDVSAHLGVAAYLIVAAWRWAGIGSWPLVIVVAGAMATASCPDVWLAKNFLQVL